ncbi:hypothetical protein LINPERPRIM_LOCUS11049 [Linum perenne]
MVHSKRRNKLMQQKMNDLVYVKYNSRLISNQLKKKKNVCLMTLAQMMSGLLEMMRKVIMKLYH